MTNQTAERCIKALTRNGFDVRTAATAAEAREIIRSIIDQTAPASISFGDSMTLYATGTVAWLREQPQIPFIDTFEPGVPFRDLIERRRTALTCGLFLTGINAVCEDGSLHWLDMIGNRIAPHSLRPAQGGARSRPQQDRRHTGGCLRPHTRHSRPAKCRPT